MRLFLFLLAFYALPVGASETLPVSKCVNLSNGLDAPYEGAWGYRIEDNHIAAIAREGFDTIRFPVRFQQSYADGRLDPELMARVDHVIETALAEGLKVILDFHHFEEIMSDPEGNSDLFVAIWTEISKRYEGWTSDLMFELLNEPNDKLTTEKVDALYDRVIPIIRTRHPDRWIIVGGGSWSIWSELENLKPRDPKTAFTFHFYDPFFFTHQGATWVSDPPPPRRGPLTEAERIEMTRDIMSLRDFPGTLFLGEFGTHVEVGTAQRAVWTKTVRQAAEAADIPWCHWGFASGFRIVRDDMTWLPGFQDALFQN
jgi:endoglucanase